MRSIELYGECENIKHKKSPKKGLFKSGGE
jgi:hypothetical protein